MEHARAALPKFAFPFSCGMRSKTCLAISTLLVAFAILWLILSCLSMIPFSVRSDEWMKGRERLYEERRTRIRSVCRKYKHVWQKNSFAGKEFLFDTKNRLAYCRHEKVTIYGIHMNTFSNSNRECSQVRMVDAISQPGCAECGAGGLVLTDYRPFAFLRALLLMTYTYTD